MDQAFSMSTRARFMFMAARTKRRWQALRARPQCGAHAVPLLHRRVSVLDAAVDAQGPGIVEPLPIFERVVGPPAPGHAVDQTAPFERLAESLAAVGLVDEIALLVALDQRFRRTKVMHIGRSHLGLPDKSA